MSNVIIHHCEFPSSVETQQDVWPVYHWLKEKMGGKSKAPKIESIIKELCKNWDKYFLEYSTHINSGNLFDTAPEETLTTRKNHAQRDTIAIAKFKQYIFELLKDSTIDRKKLKTLLEDFRD